MRLTLLLVYFVLLFTGIRVLWKIAAGISG